MEPPKHTRILQKMCASAARRLPLLWSSQNAQNQKSIGVAKVVSFVQSKENHAGTRRASHMFFTGLDFLYFGKEPHEAYTRILNTEHGTWILGHIQTSPLKIIQASVTASRDV